MLIWHGPIHFLDGTVCPPVRVFGKSTRCMILVLKPAFVRKTNDQADGNKITGMRRHGAVSNGKSKGENLEAQP